MNNVIPFKFILFFVILGANFISCHAQWLKYDNMLSASLGYSWGPIVTSEGMPLPNSQHMVSLGAKLFGILVLWDFMPIETDYYNCSNHLVKFGIGARHDFGKNNKNALAFTPYIGVGCYKSELKSASFIYEDDKFTTFVFGSRISYYHKKTEINLDVSNRNVGVSVGIGIWGDNVVDMWN